MLQVLTYLKERQGWGEGFRALTWPCGFFYRGVQPGFLISL